MQQHKPAVPKHIRIRDKLRARILSDYKPGMRLPPEAEFFRKLGVSSTTVVRALNDLAREGVIHRRRGSGTYVADRQVPPLIPGRQLKLGILWHHSVVPSELDSFCGRVTRGILRGLGVTSVDCEFEQDQAHNVTRARWSLPARALTIECLGNPLAGVGRKPTLETVVNSRFDGVITIGILEEDWIEAILKSGCPVTIVDFPTQRLSAVADVIYANPQSGFRQVVDDFVKSGLRRIHFVGALIFDPETRIPDPTTQSGYRYARRTDPDSFLRLSAYRQAMDAHGISIPDSWVHFVPTVTTELPALFAALPPDQRPQALICHEASRARKILTECEALGVKLEAAGGAETPVEGRVKSICLDSGAMGEVAAETLISRLRQPARPFLNIGVRMNVAPAPVEHPAISQEQRASH